MTHHRTLSTGSGGVANRTEGGGMRTREEYLKEYDSYSEDYCFRGLQDLFWELLAALAEKERDFLKAQDRGLQEARRADKYMEQIAAFTEKNEEIKDDMARAILAMNDQVFLIAALIARLRIEEPHPFGEGYDALDLATDRIKALTARIKELEEIILRQQEEGAGAIDCINKLTRQIESMQVEANRNMEELCELRGKVTPLIDKAADFIGCPDDLKSIACIEVALNHANKLREELREERERIKGLEEELESTQRELDRARGSKAALRKE
jgi:chromosome segregation ATPase